MGVVNITPDSFSDGGRHAMAEAAIASGLAMMADGADIVDVGGESTRPGAFAVAPELERERVLPVIAGLAARGVRVSVDTRNAVTMTAALDAGASIVNDVSGLTYDPAAAHVVAERGCPVILMHMRGVPETMQRLAVYDNAVAEVVAELRAMLDAALRSGIGRDAIVLDPGIGFAKDADQSAAVLRDLAAIAALGCPVLAGVSRKSFIGRFGREPDPNYRLPGSLAAGLFAVSRGASILRVHDVRETVQALRVWTALSGDRG